MHLQLNNYQQFQLRTRGNILLKGNVKYTPAAVSTKIVGNCIFSDRGITIHQHTDGYTVAYNNEAITLPYMPAFSYARLKKLLHTYGIIVKKEEVIELENGNEEAIHFNNWCEQRAELQMDDAYGY